jgi:D-aminoacyl-tRNA deacylase
VETGLVQGGAAWVEKPLALVYSVEDAAGSGAAEKLTQLLPGGKDCSIAGAAVCRYYPSLNTVLAGFHGETVNMEYLDEKLASFNPTAYIVLSRHASTSGKPTMSLHYPGNPGREARLGGKPRQLAYTWPRLFSLLARLYYEEASRRNLLERYSFSLEATHHGPTGLKRPIMFIEIGSEEKEWKDPEAREAMAAAVASLVRRFADNGVEALPTGCRVAVGVGGTHYPEKHTRLLLEGKACYGHIFAKYVLGELDEEVLAQAVDKSVDKVEGFIVLKIPGRVRRLVEGFAEKHGLEVWRSL